MVTGWIQRELEPAPEGTSSNYSVFLALSRYLKKKIKKIKQKKPKL